MVRYTSPSGGITMTEPRKRFASPVTRRSFLQRAGIGGAAVLGGTLWPKILTAGPSRPQSSRLALNHVIISCQENRSFDHYFGYAPQVQALGYVPPSGYSQPDAAGNPHAPFEFTQLSTPQPNQNWQASHAQLDGGKMDGFFQTAQAYNGDGTTALGYYTAKELPFYYSLLDDSALCANYFCSAAGPTWPNRFYLMSGTSGGITTNGKWGYGIFDSGGWPI